MTTQKAFDVIIIGGSYAGLSAAMALGRSLRRVLIIDSGTPCNRQTPHSHNFITQDGQPPEAIASQAKEQVLRYPSVTFTHDEAVSATGQDHDFTVSTASGRSYQAGKLLFATGVKDLMPDIPGFAACWGISILHCPYCHGYEFRERKTGILANGEMAYEFGKLIRNWTGDLTLFTNGKAAIAQDQLHQLRSAGIAIAEQEIERIEHRQGHIEAFIFKDGSQQVIDALYARTSFVQHCEIPQTIGCKLTGHGLIDVDDFQQTSVPGIYAAGDNLSPLRAVSAATASGTKAGAFINKALIEERFSEKLTQSV